MTQKLRHHTENQFWIFWVGLLTGALIVGLIFGYQAIQQTQELQNALLKTWETKAQFIWPADN